jgi:isocitrate lyase
MTIDSWRSPEAIKAWWASPSQSALRRPYTAEEVAALRDVFPEASHSNELALKLRGIFEKHRQNKTINIAMSVLDAVSLQMMAEEGFGGSCARKDSAELQRRRMSRARSYQ